MSKKELTVKTTVITQEKEKQSKCSWDDITEAEREIIRRIITDRFMEEAGYRRADQIGQMGQNKKQGEFPARL